MSKIQPLKKDSCGDININNKTFHHSVAIMLLDLIYKLMISFSLEEAERSMKTNQVTYYFLHEISKYLELSSSSFKLIFPRCSNVIISNILPVCMQHSKPNNMHLATIKRYAHQLINILSKATYYSMDRWILLCK